MLNRIISALERCGVPTWRVTEQHAETAELYFIKKALDMPRMKNMSRYKVEVFKDFEEDGTRFRGSTNTLLSPGMSDEEIEARINSAWFAASFVKNPWFELPEGIRADKLPDASDMAGMTIEDAVMKLAEGIFAIDTDEDAFLNSVELFVTRSTTRIVASNGLDVSYDKTGVEGELVAQCVTPKDVEQFRTFEYDSLAIGSLQQLAKDAIRDVRARARSTQPPKAGAYDIVLTGEHIREILSFYTTRSGAGMIYPGYSEWKLGENVQGEVKDGEKLNLKLVPSEPYSAEGIRQEERPLLTDGVLETIHGGAQMCYYLGIAPTGLYRKISSSNGTAPVAQLRGEGVLEPVSFSDFQMDPFDGHFKGEIRLALLHHADGSVEELSGGSINGSLTDAQGDLVFSAERYSDSTYDGPLAVKIPGVQVAGI